MPKYSSLRQPAIVGVGTSAFHELYRHPRPGGETPDGLGMDVLRSALADAGLRVSDLDGLIVSGIPWYPHFACRTGLRDVNVMIPYPMSGRQCATALGHAAMVVQSGQASCVALVYATPARSGKMAFGGEEDTGDLYDSVFGLTSPGARYAVRYSRYLDEYGYQGREDLLGAVAVELRRAAGLNPDAVFQEPLTIEDYLKARYIARPLRLFDYCVPCDGGVCYIVTTIERARSLRAPPVVVAGAVDRATLCEQFIPEDAWQGACQDLAKRLLDGAKLELSDISSLQVYDNFSVSILWALEGMGFCNPGEALDWIQDGRIAIGGELPVNTSGGMMSEAYMQGWSHHAEAVRQLRGEAGARQVEDCRAIMYACLAPVSSATLLIADAQWLGRPRRESL